MIHFKRNVNSRLKAFIVRSIKSFAEFWLVFLETWMERIELVADSPSIQGLKNWNDDHTVEEMDENFSSTLSSYLNSFECKSEDKIQFLDEVAKSVEKEIEF